MTRVHDIAMTSASAAVILFAFSSCTLPVKQGPASTTPQGKPNASHIAQLDRGRDAYFAQCIEPACPTTTPKTLAVAVAVADPQTQPQTSMQGNARALESIAPADVTKPAPLHKPQVLVLEFATDSAVLTPAHRTLLNNAAKALGRAERVLVVGRTDNVGPDAPNQAIALARAGAVRDHIKRVSPAQPNDIRIDARGLCCYIASNDTPEGRARNRRVEVVFTAPSEGVP
ncbi:MAG: OmpA family protein [Leptothrix sp. (in: Bacteria)]|nr:OmpA family protein [Leptothrix sp. (in: b-proteobacteria)]